MFSSPAFTCFNTPKSPRLVPVEGVVDGLVDGVLGAVAAAAVPVRPPPSDTAAAPAPSALAKPRLLIIAEPLEFS
jgi:hypothetical protein